MMKEGRLVCRAPQSLGEKTTVALLELLRPCRLVHVEGLGVLRFTDIMELEIGIPLDPNGAGGVRPEPWRRQDIARKIDLQITRFAATQIAWRIEWIGLRVDPALFVERQAGNVTRGAADPFESAFAEQDGLFN